jgi:ribosome biogenesis GTPase / thiamine phosphate phosphatase
VPSLDFPWRVVADYGSAYNVRQADDLRTVSAPLGSGLRPTTGDFVRIDERSGRIVDVAERRTWIARARPNGEPQIVAANVTAAFLVTSPEPREFSPRRVSRYLIALRAGGIDALILLNKCECDESLGAHIGALREVADGAPVLPISARDGTGCDALAPYLTQGSTVALCGSSGVGKSTLLNRLAGGDVMTTSPMRDDGRGRHTTTLRRLVELPGGAAMVDTPGMRTFLPWAHSSDIDAAFDDVAVAARRCRFADCTHDAEPGCAVRDAVASERLEQWQKLRRELAWLETRDDPLAAAERKRKWKAIHKAARRMR